MSEEPTEDDRQWVIRWTQDAAKEILRIAAQKYNDDQITVGSKEFPMVNFGLLLRLLGGGAALVLIWFVFIAPAIAKPALAEKREASYACQRKAIPKSGPQKGHILPAATCACNSKVGLPEYHGCRALRQKGG